jgi:hypothetical protein
VSDRLIDDPYVLDAFISDIIKLSRDFVFSSLIEFRSRTLLLLSSLLRIQRKVFRVIVQTFKDTY